MNTRTSDPQLTADHGAEAAMVPAAVTRRRLFHVGLAGAAVLGLGLLVSRRLDGGPAGAAGAHAAVPLALSPRRLGIVAALAEALYPGGGKLPAALELGVPQRIDQELYFADEGIRSEIELALDVLEYGGPLLGWWGRFSRLEPARRLRAIEALHDHSLGLARQIAVGLSQLVQVFYYAQAETWGPIGYDGPWMPASAPPTAVHYQEQLAARQEPRP